MLARRRRANIKVRPAAAPHRRSAESNRIKRADVFAVAGVIR
jgi:hypothetical protein